MKRQRVQILVLAVALLALAGVFLGVRYYNQVQAKKPAEEEEEVITVIDLAEEDVRVMSYTCEGETITFELEGDTWYDAEDHSLKLRQYMLSAMAGEVAPLTAERKIENVTDLEQYGLTQPQTAVTVETTGGSYTWYIGDKNTVTGDYYVRLSDDDTVYTVSADVVSKFQRPVDELLEDEEPASEETGGDAVSEPEGSEAELESSAE